MKKFVFAAMMLLIGLVAFAQEPPKEMKTSFSEAALNQIVYTPEGDSLSMKEVFRKHKGKVLVLDIWAGWCKDCIAVMQESKNLAAKYPKVKFIYLSLDRNDSAWHKAMDKYQLKGFANYWFKAGWKNDFTNDIELNWIPRYMVVDRRRKIKGYYFVHPTDVKFTELLDSLSR